MNGQHDPHDPAIGRPPQEDATIPAAPEEPAAPSDPGTTAPGTTAPDRTAEPADGSAAGGAPDADEDAATRRYLDLIRSIHEEWETLEEAGDRSVQLSPTALSTIKESVRADARHGAHVTMPPTAAGPFTVSELTLRTIVRRAVDAVPGALALRTGFEHEEAGGGVRTRGLPRAVHCRISAELGTPNLRALAEQVREAVITACDEHTGLPAPRVDIHIEDLHEH